MLLIEAFDSAGQKIDAVNLQFGLFILVVAIILGILLGYLSADYKSTNKRLGTIKIIDKEVTRFEKESLKILHQLYGEETKTIENVNHVCKVFYIRSAFYIMMRGFITNRLESDIHDIVSDLIDICNVSDFSEPKEKSQK